MNQYPPINQAYLAPPNLANTELIYKVLPLYK